jgi:hypothetical protein
MDLFNLLVKELYKDNKEILAEDIPEGFGVPITPVVSYFCFETPLDMIYFKDDILKEEILSEASPEKTAEKKAKKEISSAKWGKTSKETGTVYKLTSEQKRALKYIKKKYGKEISKEIKTFRENFLAPYQVIKNNLEKSKSLYPKEVYGLSKEEYLRLKKRAEYKIENMRSDTYSDLNKEYFQVGNKAKGVDEIEKITADGNINQTALRKVFEKYDLKSTRFTDLDFQALKNKIKDVDNYMASLVDKLESDNSISKEDLDKLKKKSTELDVLKKRLTNTAKSPLDYDKYKKIEKAIKTDDIDKFRKILSTIEDFENNIKDSDLEKDSKERIIKNIDKYISINNEKITNKSFADEYEMFLMREKITEQIKNNERNKYTEEYLNQLAKVKERIYGRKEELLDKMAKERANKSLTDEEKKIYQLKPGVPKDSNKLSDYILKIKEEDFFNPIFFEKSEKMKQAEKKIDAEIKRFERSLQSKMEEKDFKLLKKYRLINNLITIKNLKNAKDLFLEKD